jgi:quinol monooxygenase YgiN
MAKQVIVVETIYAKPGKGVDLKQALLEMLATSLNEPGCLQYEIAEPEQGNGVFLVLMRWENMSQFKAHGTAPHIQDFVKKYDNILYREFQENVWVTC